MHSTSWVKYRKDDKHNRKQGGAISASRGGAGAEIRRARSVKEEGGLTLEGLSSLRF